MSEATLRDKKYITESDWDNPETSMAAVSVRCTSVYFFVDILLRLCTYTQNVYKSWAIFRKTFLGIKCVYEYFYDVFFSIFSLLIRRFIKIS